MEAQQVAIQTQWKHRKNGKRPRWLHEELLGYLKFKKQTYRQGKDGQTTTEAYQETAKACREKIRKAKVKSELYQGREAKNNTKKFYKYIKQKRKTKKVWIHCSISMVSS